MAKYFKIQGSRPPRGGDPVWEVGSIVFRNEFFENSGISASVICTTVAVVFSALSVSASGNASASASSLNSNYTVFNITVTAAGVAKVDILTANFINYVASTKGNSNTVVETSNNYYIINDVAASSQKNVESIIDILGLNYSINESIAIGNSTVIFNDLRLNYLAYTATAIFIDTSKFEKVELISKITKELYFEIEIQKNLFFKSGITKKVSNKIHFTKAIIENSTITKQIKFNSKFK